MSMWGPTEPQVGPLISNYKNQPRKRSTEPTEKNNSSLQRKYQGEFKQYCRILKIRINTPILPVKKPHSDEYLFLQDLRAINDVAQGSHPTVLNLYTLLTTVPRDSKWFLVLNLKDASAPHPTPRPPYLNR